MAFLYELIRSFRLENGIKVVDFACAVSISVSHLYHIEDGKKNPSLDTFENIVRLTGIPMESFFNDEAHTVENSQGLFDLLGTISRERASRIAADKLLIKAERSKFHLIAILGLHTQYMAILHMDIGKAERAQKVEALAKAGMKSGEVSFGEILNIVNVRRATLKNWLESERTEYICRLIDVKPVIASTPGEAGLMLKCFDCDDRDKGNCLGYGGNQSYDNIFALIAAIEATGTFNREEQSQKLRDHYGIDVSAHRITDLFSRHKHGKPVDENLVNMELRKLKR